MTDINDIERALDALERLANLVNKIIKAGQATERQLNALATASEAGDIKIIRKLNILAKNARVRGQRQEILESDLNEIRHRINGLEAAFGIATGQQQPPLEKDQH